MKIVIHRGTHEIGGTCIEVTAGSTRLVLDLGLPLVTSDREPFDASAAMRKTTAELVAEGTAPNIAGLFDEDQPAPDAILLSHAHLDHMGLIHRSRGSVPVYATAGTSKMMLAGAVFAGRESLDRNRHQPIKAGQPFNVGEATITPLAVDHSTFGSVAFLIEAEGQRILYSGDLRNHGRKLGMLRTLLCQIKGKPVDVLLVEGTHLGSGKTTGASEFDIEEQVVETVKAAPGLVLYSFSPQDVDRVVTAYRASQRTGRTFVADGYTAFIMHLVQHEARIPPPKKVHGIRVYFNEGYRRKKNAKLNSIFATDRIELEEILREPHKHLMVFRPSMTNLDFGGTLPLKTRVLYGYWKGYLKNADWVELQAKVTDAGGDFIPAHASGHIHVADLIEFVKTVDAKTVIPVHTFEPGELAKLFPNVLLLKDRECHELV
jgi:ribonuclease J